MSLVKYGGGIVQMSGSIAGNTFARNRFGNYVRARTKPINTNSTAQSHMRSVVGQLAQMWRTDLDAAKRTAWGTYANAVAMKNRLGETTYLTGFNHFIRGNAMCLMNGGVVITAGPTTLALPEKDPAFAVSASVASQLITVTLNEALPWFTTVTCFMGVFSGQPQSVTRNFFAGPWKWAGAIPANQGDPHTVPAPYTLILGQKIWVYSRIQLADGRLSEAMVASCTIAA